MNKIILSCLVLCWLTASKAFGQAAPVPEHYSLRTDADFRNYETDVINTINWLEQTPWSTAKEDRKQANTFLMTWITGSPTITLTINSPILIDISDKNPELLNIFMGGYLKYALQNKDAKDRYDVNKAYVAGTHALITKYLNESQHIKDGNVDYLIKIERSGKLESWVTREFNRAR